MASSPIKAHIKSDGVWRTLKKLHIKQADRWVPVKKGFVRQGKVWTLFFQSRVVIDVANTRTNFKLVDAVVAQLGHAPTEAIEVQLNIAASGVLGATSVGNTALTIGRFPTGSIIIINNQGKILGAGGVPNGGKGGNAIDANVSGQTVTINNQAGAVIYAGGGAGGQGGKGGAGGTGSRSWADGLGLNWANGGAGGVGGSGGAGGIGRGFNISRLAGTSGKAGTSGVVGGGWDPGLGGAGGTGGTGGSGGEWGLPGKAGAVGTQGKAGGSNGFGAGGTGTAGSAGTSGGMPGNYLVKGSATVTLNNRGTVAGSLA